MYGKDIYKFMIEVDSKERRRKTDLSGALKGLEVIDNILFILYKII